MFFYALLYATIVYSLFPKINKKALPAVFHHPGMKAGNRQSPGLHKQGSGFPGWHSNQAIISTKSTQFHRVSG
jgi:hypothetical protein